MSEENTAAASNPVEAGSEKQAAAHHAPKILRINAFAFILSTILAIVAICMLFGLVRTNERSEAAHNRYDVCEAATVQLMNASDYLTTESRMYVATGDEQHLYNYLEEILVTKRRDEALETLRKENGDSQAVTVLGEALRDSNKLAERELFAMRLTAEAFGLEPLPDQIANQELDQSVSTLSAQEKNELANAMLLGGTYNDMKTSIVTNVDECTEALLNDLEREKTDAQAVTDNLTIALFVIVVLLVVIIGAAVIANYRLVMKPMRIHARNIRDNEPLEYIGSYELLNVVGSYNQIFKENHRRTMLLKHEAETDALTNLLNRGSYDKVLKHHGDNIALVIIDVDLFKDVNDTYGHTVGDQLLQKVAAAIDYHFRATDYVCRIGGDEFAVVLTEVTPQNRAIIEAKLKLIADDLRDTSDGLPVATLSAGIAFSSDIEPGENIYHAADKALYDAKHKGRDTHSFYSDTLDR